MIDVVDLSPSDVLVCKVPVGNMPLARAKEYLDQVKSNIRELFGEEQKILLIPAKDWDTSTELAVIHRTV